MKSEFKTLEYYLKMKKSEYTMRQKLKLDFNFNFKYYQNEEDREYIEKHRIGISKVHDFIFYEFNYRLIVTFKYRHYVCAEGCIATSGAYNSASSDAMHRFLDLFPAPKVVTFSTSNNPSHL